MLEKLKWPVLSFLGSLLFWAFTYGSFIAAAVLMTVILIHEMGHYLAARWLGIKVEPPLFVIIGAFVKFENDPTTVRDDVIVSIAGPLLGAIAAVVTFVAGGMMGSPVILAAAKLGFILNLFQLIPVPPLDGGHIARGLDRRLWKVGIVIVLAYSVYALVYFGNFMPALFVFLFWNQVKAHMEAVERQARETPWVFRLPAGEKAGLFALYILLTVGLIFGVWLTR
ncbi:MAG TPA: site-2 protease family protein [Candidatus Obscuribacterales bacterium]